MDNLEIERLVFQRDPRLLAPSPASSPPLLPASPLHAQYASSSLNPARIHGSSSSPRATPSALVLAPLFVATSAAARLTSARITRGARARRPPSTSNSNASSFDRRKLLSTLARAGTYASADLDRLAREVPTSEAGDDLAPGDDLARGGRRRPSPGPRGIRGCDFRRRVRVTRKRHLEPLAGFVLLRQRRGFLGHPNPGRGVPSRGARPRSPGPRRGRRANLAKATLRRHRLARRRRRHLRVRSSRRRRRCESLARRRTAEERVVPADVADARGTRRSRSGRRRGRPAASHTPRTPTRTRRRRSREGSLRLSSFSSLGHFARASPAPAQSDADGRSTVLDGPSRGEPSPGMYQRRRGRRRRPERDARAVRVRVRIRRVRSRAERLARLHGRGVRALGELQESPRDVFGERVHGVRG